MPNVLSPRDLVSRPDIMDKTVPHIQCPYSQTAWPMKAKLQVEHYGEGNGSVYQGT